MSWLVELVQFDILTLAQLWPSYKTFGTRMLSAIRWTGLDGARESLRRRVEKSQIP